MNKPLVAFYSWTGKTARVAHAVAEALSADIEQIHDAKPRKGVFAFLGSAIEARRRKPAPIASSGRDVRSYDLVVLGAPVWAGEMASPLRAYIEREQSNLRRVALFCTSGGANGERALSGMRAACGRTPIANLVIDASALRSGVWRAQVDDFVRKLHALAAQPTDVASP